MPTELLIRPAVARDDAALSRLASLDSARPLRGDVLVAEVAGELWAALELHSGAAVADPFRPSAALVKLLRLRAATAGRRPARARGRLRRLRPSLA